ncbi:oligosaccharide flippase family protein [Brevibacillus sp. B_LB10_24]|uniref:oligosaccharide flippase family protein n=1 Tax=Brevibacillus sp. B_LB10_24 TaxID=3380645 RepID=UPI0038B9FFC7
MRLPVIFKQMVLRTGAIFLVKVIGALVRIPMFRMLGPEGIGLYEMAYAFYGFVLSIVSGGFPSALALTTAKDRRRGYGIYWIVFLLLALAGGLCGLASYHYAPQIAAMFGNPNLVWPLRLLAPAMMIVPLLGITRGFLQGIESYGTIAVSEVIEQLVRVATILLCVTMWTSYGIGRAVGGATFGASTGAFVAFVFLFAILMSRIKKRDAVSKLPLPLAKRKDTGIMVFFYTSVSVLATRLFIPMADFIDTLIVPHRLVDSGLTIHQATAIYGEISGMAATITYLPTIITAALSHTLVAKITADWAGGRIDRFRWRISKAFEFGWLWGAASSGFLYFYANDLSVLIMGDESLTNPIKYTSMAPMLVGLFELSNTVIWVTEMRKAPVIGLAVGEICTIVISYVLCAIPGMGHRAAAIGLLTLEFVATAWNLGALKWKVKGFFPLGSIFQETVVLFGIVGCSFLGVNFLVDLLPWSEYVRMITRLALSLGLMMLYFLVRFMGFYKKSLH